MSWLTLAAEGAPVSVAASVAATGRNAHIDTAAVGGAAARRAGLRVGRRTQIIQLREEIDERRIFKDWPTGSGWRELGKRVRVGTMLLLLLF